MGEAIPTPAPGHVDGCGCDAGGGVCFPSLLLLGKVSGVRREERVFLSATTRKQLLLLALRSTGILSKGSRLRAKPTKARKTAHPPTLNQNKGLFGEIVVRDHPDMQMVLAVRRRGSCPGWMCSEGPALSLTLPPLPGRQRFCSTRKRCRLFFPLF